MNGWFRDAPNHDRMAKFGRFANGKADAIAFVLMVPPAKSPTQKKDRSMSYLHASVEVQVSAQKV
jgi:hypothetical protein